MSNYTSGPWYIHHPRVDGNSRGTYGIDSEDGTAVVWHGQTIEDGIRRVEDARLIAAAPELLEALQVVRDYVVTMKGRGHEYQVMIDAAIAKATGAAE